MTELPDRAALEAELLPHQYRRGEAHAFAELIDRWEMRLSYYIRRLVGRLILMEYRLAQKTSPPQPGPEQRRRPTIPVTIAVDC